ncbi:hypothetical protein [Corynebacterium durum]
MVMQSYDQFLEQFQQRAERYVAEFDESIRAVQKELEQRRKKGETTAHAQHVHEASGLDEQLRWVHARQENNGEQARAAAPTHKTPQPPPLRQPSRRRPVRGIKTAGW